MSFKGNRTGNGEFIVLIGEVSNKMQILILILCCSVVISREPNAHLVVFGFFYAINP